MSALVFEASSHTYALDGIPLPSVTGVLGAAGLIDFSHVPADILDAARARGSLVHQAIHYYNERDLDVTRFIDEYPGLGGYLLAWISFCRQRKFIAVLNEHRIASRRHQVAGTFDCLGLLDGGAVLMDFKTGRPDDAATHLQTAAYLNIAREWAREDALLAAFFEAHPVVRRHAVQLRANGCFVVETYTAPEDFRHFTALAAEQRKAA